MRKFIHGSRRSADFPVQYALFLSPSYFCPSSNNRRTASWPIDRLRFDGGRQLDGVRKRNKERAMKTRGAKPWARMRLRDIDSMHSGLFASRLKGLRRELLGISSRVVLHRFFLAMYNLWSLFIMSTVWAMQNHAQREFTFHSDVTCKENVWLQFTGHAFLITYSERQMRVNFLILILDGGTE